MNLTWAFVALLYALAVWISRRVGSAFPWRIAALFYALVLIFLWRPMTGPWVNLPVDIVETLPPWWGMARDHRVANMEINDIVMQIVPWAHQVREAWKSLHFPIWNALSGSGYPLLANGQSSGFSPIRILALPLRIEYAFTAEAAMKMLIAMSFMFAFCRRRWSDLASAFGAIAFGYCTFVQTWLHFPLVTVGVWIPAAMLAVELIMERPTWFRFTGSIALWAAMLLGGHPETAAHIAFLALLYAAWLAIVEKRSWQNVGILVVSVGVAAIIASPFLAPFIEALHKSKRYQQLKDYPNAIGYYSDFWSAIVLFQPHFFGHIPLEKSWGPEAAESITGFAGVLGVAGWFGLAIRAIVERRWRDRDAFLLLATFFVLGILLAWPGISNAFQLIFALAANARLRLLFCWLVAALTAAILDVTLRGRAAYLLAGLAICAAMLLWLMVKMPFPHAVWKDTAMVAILPSAMVIALSILFLLPARVRPAAATVVLAAFVTELWSASSGWNPVLPIERSYPVTPLIARLQQMYATTPKSAPFRVVGLGPALFPNAQAMYGIEDIRAHDPMANGPYLAVLRVVTGFNPDKYFAKWDDADTRFLDFLNVKYVVTGAGTELHDPQRYARVYSGRDGDIFRNNDVLPRFFAARNVVLEFKGAQFASRLEAENDWAHTGVVKTLPVESDRMRQDLLAPRPPTAPEATVKIVDSSGTRYRLHVHAPRWTLVVSSVPIWPGWQIRMPGRRLEPLSVNGAFLGFTIPPGDYDVSVYYAPVSFYAALLASILTIAVLIALSIRSRRRLTTAAARPE